MKIINLIILGICLYGMPVVSRATPPFNAKILEFLTKGIFHPTVEHFYYRDSIDNDGMRTAYIDSSRVDTMVANENGKRHLADGSAAEGHRTLVVTFTDEVNSTVPQSTQSSNSSPTK